MTLLLALVPVAAQAWSVSDLLSTLAANTPQRLIFEEEREVGLMQTRVRGEGELRFDPPDTFVRELHHPHSERLRIEGEQVTVMEGGEVRHELRRGDDAGVDALILLVRALYGQAEARDLEQGFDMQLEGDREQWRWVLVPRERGAKRRIERMTLYGSGGRVARSVLREGDGDRIETRYRTPR